MSSQSHEGPFGLNRLLRLTLVTGLLLTIVTGCNARTLTVNSGQSAQAKSLVRESNNGPVQLTVRVTPESPRLSDLVSLELLIKAEEGIEIIPPVFGKAVGDFLVLDYSEQSKTNDNQPLPPNSRAFRYQLEPAHSGKHIIRSISIEFIDRRDKNESEPKTQKIQSTPIELEITSELGNSIPDLADLDPMVSPKPLAENKAWLWAIAFLMIAGSTLLIWYGVKTIQSKPNTIVVSISPEELAKKQLRELLDEQLPQKGLVKEFYLRLTGIVRHYIESTTGLKAPEQTTEEFLRDLHRSNSIKPDQAVRLGDFLEAADMVKYAGQQPTSEQIDLSVERATEFISIQTVQPLTQSDSPEQTKTTSLPSATNSQKGAT